MSDTSQKIDWYLARDGQQHGPLSEAELGKFVELGHLRATDLLWRVGFAEWRAAADVFPDVFAPKVPAVAAPASPPEPAEEVASIVETAAPEQEVGNAAVSEAASDERAQSVSSDQPAAAGSDLVEPDEATFEGAEVTEGFDVEADGGEPTVSPGSVQMTPDVIAMPAPDTQDDRDQNNEPGTDEPAAPSSPVETTQEAVPHRLEPELEPTRPVAASHAARSSGPRDPSELVPPTRDEGAAPPGDDTHVARSAAAAWQAAADAQAAKGHSAGDGSSSHASRDQGQYGPHPYPQHAGPAYGMPHGPYDPRAPHAQLGPVPGGHPGAYRGGAEAHAGGYGPGLHGPAAPAQTPFAHGPMGAPGSGYPHPHAQAPGQPGGPALQGPIHGPAAPGGVRFGSAIDDGFRPLDSTPTRRSWASSLSMLAFALIALAIVAAGGWYALRGQVDFASIYEAAIGAGDDGAQPIVRAPRRATREPASEQSATRPDFGAGVNAGRPAEPQRTALATSPDPAEAPSQEAVRPAASTTPLMRSKLWQELDRQFPDWVAKRTEEVRKLQAASRSDAEVNRHLVNEFVAFRRSNAELALSAPLENLEAIVEAFVANLRALAGEDERLCYAFISRGESSDEIAPLFADPVRSQLLQNQSQTIVGAIVAAKATSKLRQPPEKADFDALSEELRKKGWTQSDLAMFSDPAALSRASPKTVCRLVTDWFVTQTKIADPQRRSRLIAASLRPVVAG